MHTGPGGSLTAALADLETIWGHIIQKQLDIPLKDLKVGGNLLPSLSTAWHARGLKPRLLYTFHKMEVFSICVLPFDGLPAFQYYRCILLVPDIYNRQHIKEVVNMLLLNMGFSGIVMQIRENVHDLFGVECNHIFLFCPRTSLCVCSYHCAPRVSVCYIWQWPEQCVCCGCGRPEDKLELCWGWSVPPELKVWLSHLWLQVIFFIQIHLQVVEQIHISNPQLWSVMYGGSRLLMCKQGW